jgi:ATP-dependent Lon protease
MPTLNSEIMQPVPVGDDIGEYPLLPLRDTIIFPRTVTPLSIGRNRSNFALEAALAEEGQLVVSVQYDPEQDEPQIEDVCPIGTAVTIERTLRMPDGTTNILVQGLRRVEILDAVHDEPYPRVRVRHLAESSDRTPRSEALMRATVALFEKYVELNRNLPEDAYIAAINIDEASWLADMIASMIDIPNDQRQQLLATLEPVQRLQGLSVVLAQEVQVLELETEIQNQVQQEVDKGQREHFLREQLRVIQTELGEIDTLLQAVNELRERLAISEMPEEARSRAETELNRLAALPPVAPEVAIIRNYLDWIVELPWSQATEDNMDLEHAAQVLNDNHYGLPRAKERLLEYLAVRQRAAEKMRSPILCFVGPPGTGKTSLGRSIAQALGRQFQRISLGGIRDEAEIRGHRRTYIGALPGRILQTMRRAKMVNPLFMLDEIDKVGMDFRGDPTAALLEVLDFEQNHAFSDHYLEIPYDLSKVFFITTANLTDPIPPALLDRMEIIHFSGYTEDEKVHIAHKFLIPRQLAENGLEGEPVKFSKGSLEGIIREYTYEAGVRNLDREIGRICRKLTRRLAEGKPIPKQIRRQSLTQFLGAAVFSETLLSETDEIGLATGLAWTENGGDLLPVEVNLMPGKGSLTMTGRLGEVMQESAQAALSFTRSRAAEFDIDPNRFDNTDIHIHVPEGAIAKDGPSAGITLATALISAFSERKVRREVALTGEITLRGRVLPIGGFKEKILTAHRVGIRKVVAPKHNRKDLVEIPARVRRDLDIVFVERMDDVLPLVLRQSA